LGKGQWLQLASGQTCSCPGGWAWPSPVKLCHIVVFNRLPARHQLVRALGQPTLVASTWARAWEPLTPHAPCPGSRAYGFGVSPAPPEPVPVYKIIGTNTTSIKCLVSKKFANEFELGF